jgi:hypothetical protein
LAAEWETREQVLDALGEPDEISLHGMRYYIYRSAMLGEKVDLVFGWDSDGVIDGYEIEVQDP